MKRIKYYLTALVVGALLLSSCSESFFDINVDPNSPSTASPTLVLPSGISGTAYVLGGYYMALGGYWTQQYAQAPAATQWADWETYNLTEDDFDRQFISLNAGAIYDFEYIRKNTAPTSNWKFYSIATLMQAYTYQVLADLYDKVPFTEALKSVDNLQPHYDNGQVVYDSLLLRIDNAMSKDFTLNSEEDPGNSDLVFGGSMDDWKKFANTLKLKIYLRYVNVNPAKYSTKIKALLTENNFLDKDAKYSSFKAEQVGYNPFYSTFVDRLTGNVIANKTLMDTLTNRNDPRRTKIFSASATGALYRGLATGDSKNHAVQTIKDYSTPTIGNVTPVYFFSKEEALFLVAEAQELYGTTTAAQLAYNDAINASFLSLGATIGTFKAPYNGIKSIIEQKWIAATNKNAIEAFFDLNRTGFPNFLSQSTTSVFNAGERPKRLFFPASERKTNQNTPAKVALTVPVWWAK
ncbi:MAG: SusD/RagB family nutrient-binding outer membrane lipoprotein [Paludibacter sp.]